MSAQQQNFETPKFNAVTQIRQNIYSSSGNKKCSPNITRQTEIPPHFGSSQTLGFRDLQSRYELARAGFAGVFRAKWDRNKKDATWCYVNASLNWQKKNRKSVIIRWFCISFLIWIRLLFLLTMTDVIVGGGAAGVVIGGVSIKKRSWNLAPH